MKATITTKIKNATNNKFIAQLSTSNNFSSFISSSDFQVDSFGLIKFNFTNLNPNTKYYIRIANLNGVPIDSYVGSFKTQSLGSYNFNFGFASCSWSNSTQASNQEIYDNIANKAINNQLDFFVHLGDMHYRNITNNNENLFQTAFDDVFKSSRQNNCWKNLPMYYIWDDHDYGDNDSDKNNPARNAAIAAYRRRVPSPPLAKSGNTDAIYYSFSKGRVRFIVTDLRSEREPKGLFPSNDPRQKPFSDEQKNWFFNEMLNAKGSGQIICWVNSKPWISSIQDGKDDWGGYHAIRLEIANFIQSNNLQNSIFIISGDMHALAYDDGTSANNYGNLKVCHAAALDQTLSIKGGPYKVGPITQDSGTGSVTQYGIIEITDNGSDIINIKFKGIVINKINFSESVVINENFNLYASINVDSLWIDLQDPSVILYDILPSSSSSSSGQIIFGNPSSSSSSCDTSNGETATIVANFINYNADKIYKKSFSSPINSCVSETSWLSENMISESSYFFPEAPSNPWELVAIDKNINSNLIMAVGDGNKAVLSSNDNNVQPPVSLLSNIPTRTPTPYSWSMAQPYSNFIHTDWTQEPIVNNYKVLCKESEYGLTWAYNLLAPSGSGIIPFGGWFAYPPKFSPYILKNSGTFLYGTSISGDYMRSYFSINSGYTWTEDIIAPVLPVRKIYDYDSGVSRIGYLGDFHTYIDSVFPLEPVALSLSNLRMSDNTKYQYMPRYNLTNTVICSGISKSENYGFSWTFVPFPNTGLSFISPKTFNISNNGKCLIVGVNNGRKILLSKDFGNTWVLKTLDNSPGGIIQSIHLSEEGKYQLVSLYNETFAYFSKNSGENWAIMPLPNVVRSIDMR